MPQLMGGTSLQHARLLVFSMVQHNEVHFVEGDRVYCGKSTDIDVYGGCELILHNES